MDYGLELDEILAKIWEAQGYISPKQLKPVLVYLAEQLVRFGEMQLSPG